MDPVPALDRMGAGRQPDLHPENTGSITPLNATLWLEKFYIGYKEGSHVKGPVVVDSVTFNGVVIENQVSSFAPLGTQWFAVLLMSPATFSGVWVGNT